MDFAFTAFDSRQALVMPSLARGLVQNWATILVSTRRPLHHLLLLCRRIFQCFVACRALTNTFLLNLHSD